MISPPQTSATVNFQELRSGNLGVRVATTDAEVEAGLALRYQVFFNEMGAKPSAAAFATQRDSDPFDAVADHLLVIDHAIGPGPEGVIATYRLIRRQAAAQLGRFYSADEYNIAPILQSGAEVLELGRSCVAATQRSSQAMQLLWRGIAAYVAQHGIDIMFGCASLPGTDPAKLAEPLTYLYYHHLAPPALRPVALAHRYVDMRLMDPALLDTRRALARLPPLIKGYLRLGGFVGDGAVIDHEFNTTDVAIVVKTTLITEKYQRHYERNQPDPIG